MKIKVPFLIIGIYLTVVLLYGIHDYFQSIELQERKKLDSDNIIKKLHLSFAGKISDYELIDNGLYMVHLDIIYSSVKYYDPRGEFYNYLVVIKNGKADLLGWGMPIAKIGDSLVVNTDKNTFRIYHQDSLIIYSSLSVAYSKEFYKKFRRFHRL